MNNDTSTLNKLRNYLLDNLNYYQKLIHLGRTDLLCIMSVVHSSLLLSGCIVSYDDVKKRWVFV